MTTSTEKTTDLLVAVLADLAPVVAGVTEQQKNDPTPCSDYDVAQLTDHVTGWLSTFADGFADPDGQAPRASLDGYVAPPTRRPRCAGPPRRWRRPCGTAPPPGRCKLGEAARCPASWRWA